MYVFTKVLNFFFFSSRRRHTRYWRDWSSDVCSSDLIGSSSFFNTHEISMAAQIKERRETLRVCRPQKVELLGDRSGRIKPGILRRAAAVVGRHTAVLRCRRPGTDHFERMIHQIKLDGE